MTQKANEKIKIILERILEEHSLGAENSIQHIQGFEIAVEDLLKDTDIDSVRLRRIIEHLAENGVIADFKFWNGEDAKYPGYEPFYDLYYFRFPENFREIAKDYISQLSTLDEQSKNYTNGTILYLDKNGNFWHGDNKKFCYPLDAKSNRFKIVKYLIENKGFQPTDEIITHVGTKNTKTLRSEIGVIRGNVSKFLGIDGKELFDSKNDSGYRLNPKYKILIVKD
jgi:hypothetical protein